MSETAIKVEDLSKEIKRHIVLDNLSFEVPSGKIFGIIGRNASGKTMLLRAICGLIIPTKGRVEVFGEEVGKNGSLPKSIGAIIESPGFLPHFSGLTNLSMLAMIRNKITEKDIEETMRLVGLDPLNRKPVKTYSLGMKQRLGIAQAVMENPDLLVLDEPTNGLDIYGIQDVREILLKQKENGKTILLTSHNAEDIEVLCDKVYRMEAGRFVN